jgi:protein tyrosine/serine phosphatase
MEAAGSTGGHEAANSPAYGHPVTVLATQPERFWDLQGCSNFRDLGGYHTGTGAATQWRRLFRGDAVIGATPADRGRFDDAGLRAVIDLRSTHEVALGGSYRAPGLVAHHVPLGDLLDRETRWDAWSDPAYVADRYFELCVTGGDAIAEVLAILTDPAAYPAVIHCSLGKDRTGVVTALILRAIGVPTRTVVEEYALSRHGAARLVERLQARMGTDRHDLEPYLPAMLAADPRTMIAFLHRVVDEFGSVHGYLRHLGVASTVDHLRAALLSH